MEKKLKVLRFDTSAQLVKYAEENRISKDDLVSIIKDTEYVLFFYR